MYSGLSTQNHHTTHIFDLQYRCIDTLCMPPTAASRNIGGHLRVGMDPSLWVIFLKMAKKRPFFHFSHVPGCYTQKFYTIWIPWDNLGPYGEKIENRRVGHLTFSFQANSSLGLLEFFSSQNRLFTV